MKILSPIDSIEELDGLVDAGADEFYGGFIPYNWFREYGAVNSLNRRNFLSAQIKGEEELSLIIKKAHSSGKLFDFTLNQKFFSTDQYPLVVDLIRKLKKHSVDNLIIADLGLYLFLKKENCEIPVILSTLAQVMNSKSAAFYGELGIKRIVLPRDLSLGEIKVIIENNPSISFEVFIMVGKCFNLEGFCTYEHCNPNRTWPCNQAYKINFDKKSILENEVTRQIKVWSQVNRTDACGLCALIRLKEIGVKCIKIVGRGASFERKKKTVETVRNLLNYIDNNTQIKDEVFFPMAKEKYKQIFDCNCEKANCYFPELNL